MRTPTGIRVALAAPALVALALATAACGSRADFSSYDSSTDAGFSPDGSPTFPDGLAPAASCVVVAETDLKGDGTVDLRDRRTYDARGNIVRFEVDGDPDDRADGIFDHTTSTSWTEVTDANGKPVDVLSIESRDSAPPRRTRTRYTRTYDRESVGIDNLDDGSIDIIHVTTYMNEKRRVQSDYDADGAVDITRDYFYDQQQRVIRMEMSTANGAVTRDFLNWSAGRLTITSEGVVPVAEALGTSEVDLAVVGGVTRASEQRQYLPNHTTPDIVVRFRYTGNCVLDSETQLPR